MRTLRTVFLLGVFTLLAFANSTEILRPTTDSDTGSSSWATTNCGIGTYTTNSTAGTLGRDAAGQTTSVSYNLVNITGTKKTSRVFSTWASSGNSYSALTLNVNSSGLGPTVAGKSCIVYSIDSGMTYTSIRCDTAAWAQATSTVTISPTQDLSKLRVGVCLLNSGDGSDGANSIRIFDIWTSGTLGAAAAGTGSGAGSANGPVQFN